MRAGRVRGRMGLVSVPQGRPRKFCWQPCEPRRLGEGQDDEGFAEQLEGGLVVNLMHFILLTAGLFLSLAWLLRSRAPESGAIKVRDVALDLEEMLRDRRGAKK